MWLWEEEICFYCKEKQESLISRKLFFSCILCWGEGVAVWGTAYTHAIWGMPTPMRFEGCLHPWGMGGHLHPRGMGNAYTHVLMCKGHRRTLGVLLYHSQPYSLKTGSLTKPGTCHLGKPAGPNNPISASSSARVTEVHRNTVFSQVLGCKAWSPWLYNKHSCPLSQLPASSIMTSWCLVSLTNTLNVVSSPHVCFNNNTLSDFIFINCFFVIYLPFLLFPGFGKSIMAVSFSFNACTWTYRQKHLHVKYSYWRWSLTNGKAGLPRADRNTALSGTNRG